MYLIEVYDEDIHHRGWRELPQTYSSAERALEDAQNWFECPEHLVTRVRLKETRTIAELVKPTDTE